MRKNRQPKDNKRQIKGYEPQLNVMQYHKVVEGLARKIDHDKVAKEIIEKLGKEAVSEQREHEITNEALTGALMVFSNILLHHWRKLTPKDTRIKVMYELYKEILLTIETPDEKQLAAEAEFSKQTGERVVRDKVA